jgi:hypothetical protein
MGDRPKTQPQKGFTTMTNLTTTAETDANAVEAQASIAVSDLKALVANRIGDALIAAIVLAAIWIGHSL